MPQGRDRLSDEQVTKLLDQIRQARELRAVVREIPGDGLMLEVRGDGAVTIKCDNPDWR